MGDGEHPFGPHWQSTYSGSVFFDLPDDMPEPVGITFDDLINKAKSQHTFLFNTATGNNRELSIRPVQFRIVGTTSGVLCAQKIICGPFPAADLGPEGFDQIIYTDDQIVKVGAYTSRPEIIIDFPPGLDYTRYVYGPETGGYAGSNNAFVRYQQVKKTSTAFTADLGYGTISFVVKSNLWINPRTSMMTMSVSGQSEEAADKANRKRHNEIDRMAKIDKIKKLTLPVTDSKN